MPGGRKEVSENEKNYSRRYKIWRDARVLSTSFRRGICRPVLSYFFPSTQNPTGHEQVHEVTKMLPQTMHNATSVSTIVISFEFQQNYGGLSYSYS